MSVKEEFRPVKGYEGIYEVSNLGNVKSFKFNKSKILKVSKDKYGYLKVNLYKNKKIKTRYIHQLMAIAFLNHTPNGHELVVDHIDNNPSNNNLDNLQITTHRQNISKDRKGSSKYTGVCWSKTSKKWKAGIKLNGEYKHLGYYTNEKQAADVYQYQLKKIQIV
jgi:hypothetical protein